MCIGQAAYYFTLTASTSEAIVNISYNTINADNTIIGKVYFILKYYAFNYILNEISMYFPL